MAKERRRSLAAEIGDLSTDDHHKNVVRSLNDKVKQLEAIIAQQHEHIDRMHDAKFVIPRGRATKAKGSFYRVAIPDTHGARCDKGAVAAMLADIEVLQPAEIVLLGDHLDCGGFLAQHWTLGYVAETDYTFEEDVTATNVLLDRIQAACPKAALHYLEGNHEFRIEKWCVTMALKNATDSKFLLGHISPAVVLNLEKRGIPYYAKSKSFHDLAIRGTIKLGKCYFTHGERTGQRATHSTLRDFGGCIVHGHTHTVAFSSDVTVRDGVIGAWSPGCLAQLRPYWNHTRVNDWSHGYGLQLVRPDGGFLHVNVPIIDGKSYLVQLAEPSRGKPSSNKVSR